MDSGGKSKNNANGAPSLGTSSGSSNKPQQQVLDCSLDEWQSKQFRCAVRGSYLERLREALRDDSESSLGERRHVGSLHHHNNSNNHRHQHASSSLLSSTSSGGSITGGSKSGKGQRRRGSAVQQKNSQWRRQFERQRKQTHDWDTRPRKQRGEARYTNRVMKVRTPPERPGRQNEWFDTWGRNFFCARCFAVAAGAEALCSYCNVVCHARCLDEGEQNALRRAEGSNDGWVCADCISSRRQELKDWEDTKVAMYEADVMEYCATTLSSVFRMKIQRNHYDTKRNGMILLQAAARRRSARTKFVRWRRDRRRPFVVSVLSARGIACCDYDNMQDPICIVSIHEDDRGEKQLFRFDSAVMFGAGDAPVWENQNFLVPGCNGSVLLAFTVLDFDGEDRNDFLGQIVVPMTALWSKGGVITQELTSMEMTPREVNLQPLNCDLLPLDLTGEVTVAVRPLCSLYSMCGFLLGHAAEGKSGKGSMAAIRAKKKWWCALAFGKIYLYSFFPQANTPKAEIDVCGATEVRVVRKAGEASSSMIIKGDERKWTLRCTNDRERGLWWSAIAEAKKKGSEFFAAEPHRPAFGI